jgi:CO/xanthine dehydrogenase Mo-binding subunit
MIAEDLDADWSKVRVVQSPDDNKTYGNPGFFGLLVTVGSRATPGYYEKLRIAGAQARKVLLVNAAANWKVPVEELSTEPSIVVHAKSGRRISYGEIAKFATIPNPIPEATNADLKPLAQCRYIGKDLPRVDIPLKVNGTAIYGIDTQLPNTLYASVLHAPVQGEKPETIDDSGAKAVKGVVQVTPLPHGVAVIGDTVEGTIKGKAAHKVTWSNSAAARNYTTSANMDGAMIFGLGAALIEQVNLTNGVPKESNFHDYRVTRMADVPPIEIKVISTDNPPTGIGEAGVPVVGPAIANAVARLTGKRLRQLPMLPSRVLAALHGTA